MLKHETVYTKRKEASTRGSNILHLYISNMTSNSELTLEHYLTLQAEGREDKISETATAKTHSTAQAKTG